MVAAAIVAGAAVSAGVGAMASSSASDTAAQSASSAAALQQGRYDTTRGDLAPYNAFGQAAASQIARLNATGWTAGQPNYLDMASQNLPGAMTQAQLEQTPGYQFNLAQGLKSTQSAAAARGLGVSGAALKGAATYATGLADSTYQNQFANAQARYSDILGLNTAQQGNTTNLYNRLSGTAGLGENAAAQTGAAGTALANQAGSSLIAAGNASAAGALGVGNSVTGSINSGIGNYLAYQGLQQGLNENGQTGGYAAPAPRNMASTATG